MRTAELFVIFEGEKGCEKWSIIFPKIPVEKNTKPRQRPSAGSMKSKKEIEENECLHDWSLEYVAYDGTTGQITAKSYSSPTLFHFSFAGIQEISIDLDVLVRWIMEVEMVKGDNVTLTFDGVGIIITAKKVALKIQTQES